MSEFKFGQKVKVKSGFYEGLVGILYAPDSDEYVIKSNTPSGELCFYAKPAYLELVEE